MSLPCATTRTYSRIRNARAGWNSWGGLRGDGGAGDDGECGESAQDEAVAVAPCELVDGYGETERGKAVQQRSESELRFHARECGAEAEMNAVTECEVVLLSTVDVEGLR